MQKYANTVTDTLGNVVSLASVSVYTNAAHTVAATIWSDNGANVLPTNTVTTDSLGNFSFYAADGRYYLKVTKSGVTTQFLDDVLLFDSTASTSAASINTVQSGTTPLYGWATRTAAAKMSDVLCVKDVKCADGLAVAGDGSHDDTTGIQAAINTGRSAIYFPPGEYVCTSAITVPAQTLLYGDAAIGATFGYGVHIVADYTEGTAANGFITWTGASADIRGNGGGIRGIVIWKATGRTGGTALNFTGTTSTLRSGFPVVRDVRITGDGTWSHGIISDGTAITTAGSQGIRDLRIDNAWVFNTTVADKSIWIKNNAQFSVTGGGIVDGAGSNCGVTITGAAGTTSTSQNVCVSGLYIGGTLTLDYVNAFNLTGLEVGGNVSITGNATNGEVNGRFGGTVTNSSPISQPVFVNGEKTDVWTPTTSTLTVIGTPTYTGYYTRTRNMLFFTLTIEVSGGTTASAAGTTIFAGLPVTALVIGNCVATDTSVPAAGHGVGFVQATSVYTPTWTARANTVVVQGSYRVAAP